MGPRSENRGYRVRERSRSPWPVPASMGPRSENRGYARQECERADIANGCFNGSTVREPWLSVNQWSIWSRHQLPLQWVHGPRTVVMPVCASVGLMFLGTLQWVHGPRTVVMPTLCHSERQPQKMLQWVHGPRTVVIGITCHSSSCTPALLQWVHGPRTVVIR